MSSFRGRNGPHLGKIASFFCGQNSLHIEVKLVTKLALSKSRKKWNFLCLELDHKGWRVSKLTSKSLTKTTSWPLSTTLTFILAYDTGKATETKIETFLSNFRNFKLLNFYLSRTPSFGFIGRCFHASKKLFMSFELQKKYFYVIASLFSWDSRVRQNGLVCSLISSPSRAKVSRLSCMLGFNYFLSIETSDIIEFICHELSS